MVGINVTPPVYPERDERDDAGDDNANEYLVPTDAPGVKEEQQHRSVRQVFAQELGNLPLPESDEELPDGVNNHGEFQIVDHDCNPGEPGR